LPTGECNRKHASRLRAWKLKQEEITAMEKQKTITWKAEVEFTGNPEDFKKFNEALAAARATTVIGNTPELDPSRVGYLAPSFIKTAQVAGLLNESKVQKITGLINGGIRNPHFHVGNEIFLVERDHFKTILGEIARNVFENRALQKEDYLDAIAPLMDIEK